MHFVLFVCLRLFVLVLLVVPLCLRRPRAKEKVKERTSVRTIEALLLDFQRISTYLFIADVFTVLGN